MSEDTREQILRDLAMMVQLYRDGKVSVDGGVPALSHGESPIKGVDQCGCRCSSNTQVEAGLHNPPDIISFSGDKYRLTESNIYNPVHSLTLTYHKIREDDRRGIGSNFVNTGCNTAQEVVGAFTHTNSSSVGVDNSASEVATPARTKIIIPWQRVECMEGTGDGIVIVLKGAVA